MQADEPAIDVNSPKIAAPRVITSDAAKGKDRDYITMLQSRFMIIDIKVNANGFMNVTQYEANR